MAVIWSFPGEENRKSNPYTATLVAELRKLGHDVRAPGWSARMLQRAEIIHLHWPQKVVQQSLLASLRSIAMWWLFLATQRMRGARIVWTVHNVMSHEGVRPGLERWWMKRLLAQIDGIHALSNQSLRDACETYPAIAGKRPLVAPHWTYDTAYPPARCPADARRDTIAFLGDLKPYKGLDAFLLALETGEPNSHRYVVHGQPSDDMDAARLADKMLALQRRGWTLDFVLERLSAQQMSDRLAEAGLLVLPYHKGENSGLAVLAAERGTPLLVSALPAFAPLVDELGSPRVSVIAPPLTALQMSEAFEHGQAVAGTIDAAFAQRRTPAAIVAEISKYYLFLMDSQGA